MLRDVREERQRESIGNSERNEHAALAETVGELLLMPKRHVFADVDVAFAKRDLEFP